MMVPNRALPKNSATPSFSAVFASTPLAIAWAATADETVFATPLAETVSASTSVSPSMAAYVNTPDCPQISRAYTTMRTLETGRPFEWPPADAADYLR